MVTLTLLVASTILPVSTRLDLLVVMCSALGQEGLVEEARKAGARGYILKPFDPDVVKEKIRDVAGL